MIIKRLSFSGKKTKILQHLLMCVSDNKYYKKYNIHFFKWHQIYFRNDYITPTSMVTIMTAWEDNLDPQTPVLQIEAPQDLYRRILTM